MKIRIIQYTKVRTLASQAMTGININQPFMVREAVRTPLKNISLLRKPPKGGSPAIENAPIMVRVKETGIT
ncbi:hypothetical protein D3C87_2037080 [compost metagenome]